MSPEWWYEAPREGTVAAGAGKEEADKEVVASDEQVGTRRCGRGTGLANPSASRSSIVETWTVLGGGQEEDDKNEDEDDGSDKDDGSKETERSNEGSVSVAGAPAASARDSKEQSGGGV